MKQALVALKLLCPTLDQCEYFFRNQGHGNHIGIDIIMPQHTPITSMTNGTVIKIKQWDGVTANEGNCVVVKTVDNYFVCYEHLETILVSPGR